MPDMIRDGKGSGKLAEVNSDNQLITRSINVEQRLKSTINTNYYEVSTGRINFPNDVETGFIYLQNTSTTGKIMVIDRVFYDTWESTGGTNSGVLRYYRNPTITGGTAIVPFNTNYGSTLLAEGVFYRNLTTMTAAANVWWSAVLNENTSAALEEGRIVLPANASHGISIQAPTGNTAFLVSINVAFYYFDPELV